MDICLSAPGGGRGLGPCPLCEDMKPQRKVGLTPSGVKKGAKFVFFFLQDVTSLIDVTRMWKAFGTTAVQAAREAAE